MFGLVVGSGKRPIVFRFRHMEDYPWILSGRVKHRNITVCTAYLGGTTYQELGCGVAVCNPIDQFSKRIGRKVALGKVLQKLFPDRRSGHLPFRQQVWDKYFSLELRGEWNNGKENG